MKLFFKFIYVFALATILSSVIAMNADIAPSTYSKNPSIIGAGSDSNSMRLQFVAEDNNLGILALTFKNSEYISDKAIIRLHNLFDNRVIHQATVSAVEYETMPTYIFGLPIISNSNNKKFDLLITFPDNSSTKNIKIYKKNPPILTSYYKYDLNELSKNWQKLFSFIYKKLTIYFNSNQFILVLFIFLFIFFLTDKINLLFSQCFCSNGNITKIFSPTRILLIIFNFLLVFEVLILRKAVEEFTFLNIILFALCIVVYGLTSEGILFYLLQSLLYSSLFKSIEIHWVAEKIAVWIYIFSSFLMLILMKERYLENKVSSNKLLSSIQIAVSRFEVGFFRIYEKLLTFIFSSKINMMKFFIVIFSLIIVTLSAIKMAITVFAIRERYFKNPRVSIMEPMLVYHSTKVVLYGKSFGEKKDERYRLMKNGKEIRTDYWDDSKIIFTVPLDWNPGEYAIWVERPIEWNTETIIEKTKPQTIKVLPVTGKITPDDDLYFKQMDTLRKETKEVNGF